MGLFPPIWPFWAINRLFFIDMGSKIKLESALGVQLSFLGVQTISFSLVWPFGSCGTGFGVGMGLKTVWIFA